MKKRQESRIEVGSQLRTVQVLGWEKPIGIGLPKEEVDAILGKNFAELIGLDISTFKFRF